MKKGTAIRLIAFAMLLFSLIPAAHAAPIPLSSPSLNKACGIASGASWESLSADQKNCIESEIIIMSAAAGKETAPLIAGPEEADINKIFAEELSKRPDLKGYTELVELDPRVYKYSLTGTPIKQTCTPLVACTGWSDCLLLRAIPAMIQSEKFVSPTDHLRRCKVVKKCIESTGIATESDESLVRETGIKKSCILSGRFNVGISQGGIAATFFLSEKAKPKETQSLNIAVLPKFSDLTTINRVSISAIVKNILGGLEIQGEVNVGEDEYPAVIAKVSKRF